MRRPVARRRAGLLPPLVTAALAAGLTACSLAPGPGASGESGASGALGTRATDPAVQATSTTSTTSVTGAAVGAADVLASTGGVATPSGAPAASAAAVGSANAHATALANILNTVVILTNLIAAENIAAGQPTPDAVVRAWMASPGHRANILNRSLRRIGAGPAGGGPYGAHWTQDFITPPR
ncbi:CAP domain-containing protein [Frankia sp. AgPm24]|uniref:CAP domain-containing protein n=1 Tax=Frankia sp. AgPm24 TaxID=631128 RepID=UPI00200C8651|nr:CAP domain-containing protein [Frankia sp. AgPm24]MCK9920809.1 CAP domain-containing protein [Frankia sp. AgPm24]